MLHKHNQEFRNNVKNVEKLLQESKSKNRDDDTTKTITTNTTKRV